jgi:hypothetical protein
MKKLIITFEDDSVLEKSLEKIKTLIAGGTTKKEFQVNKTKVSFEIEEPQQKIRMSIDDLNTILTNSLGEEIDVRNVSELELSLIAYYQVRYNGIDVYINLTKIDGRVFTEDDEEYSLYDKNDEYFCDLGGYVLDYYGYALDAMDTPDSMMEQFFDEDLQKLITDKGFKIETEGFEGHDS